MVARRRLPAIRLELQSEQQDDRGRDANDHQDQDDPGAPGPVNAACRPSSRPPVHCRSSNTARRAKPQAR